MDKSETDIKTEIIFGTSESYSQHLLSDVISSDPLDLTSIEQRYRIHLSSQIFVKGKFSPDEDKIIREHVDQHGKDITSLRKLAEILNRGSTESIRRRHDRLMSENDYNTSSVGPKAWKVEEEGMLIRYIFDTRLNLKGIRNRQDINLIENISENEFSECAEVLKRHTGSCYHHWTGVIVPALKTHFLGLPLNGGWKLDMMSYIVRNKIKHEKELDVDDIFKSKFCIWYSIFRHIFKSTFSICL